MLNLNPTFLSVLLIILFPLMLNGCSNSSDKASSAQKPNTTAAAKTSQKPPQTEPVYAVIGVDISGSYEAMTKKAMSISKNLVLNANPGDEYFIRTISDKSYPPENAIGHKKFIDETPVPNRFNKRARHRYAQAQRTLQAQRHQFAQTLERMTFNPAPRTDIYGFIQAASDLFANAPDGTRNTLMLATDLKDTAGFRCNPDLSDVEVIIFQFLVDADPIKSQRHREEWVQRLKGWGAQKVTVRPAN